MRPNGPAAGKVAYGNLRSPHALSGRAPRRFRCVRGTHHGLPRPDCQGRRTRSAGADVASGGEAPVLPWGPDTSSGPAPRRASRLAFRVGIWEAGRRRPPAQVGETHAGPADGPWRRGPLADARRAAPPRAPSPDARCGASSGPAPRSAAPCLVRDVRCARPGGPAAAGDRSNRRGRPVCAPWSTYRHMPAAPAHLIQGFFHHDPVTEDLGERGKRGYLPAVSAPRRLEPRSRHLDDAHVPRVPFALDNRLSCVHDDPNSRDDAAPPRSVPWAG